MQNVAELEEKHRILLVDDEPDFVQTSKEYLSMVDQSFDINVAYSASEAESLIHESKYDAIICDYDMPGPTGLDLLRALREEGNEIPFIIFTGRGKEDVVIAALNLGADFYLQKSTNVKIVFNELLYFLQLSLKKKTDNELIRKQRNELESFFEHSGTALCIADENSIISKCNSLFEDISGYPRHQIENKLTVGELLKDSPTNGSGLLNNSLNRDQSTTANAIEMDFIGRTGITKRVLVTVTTIPETQKRAFSIIDVTGRKEISTLYEELFQNLVDGFAYHQIIFDNRDRPVDYVFLEVNPAFEAITGLKRQEILGKRVTEVIPRIHVQEFINTYGKIAMGGPRRHLVMYSEHFKMHFDIIAYSPKYGFFVTVFREMKKEKEQNIN
ncbi:MAG TPA: response regulator [Candidatus Hodarchaeales archaeon]|nr:response regulator [Candidatus Hodarchaeales archaeon]